MSWLRTIRVFAVALMAGGCAVEAQSTLPATAPTVAPLAQTAQTAPLSATAIVPDATTRAHRAEIRYGDGLLSVNADNSSLNQILREIARQTGMKITGGVKEERVFGHYGPAKPADILVTLIDGTGTNMLLSQTDSDAPLELILTPQSGGATPPNPNAPGFDDSAPDDDAPAQPQALPPPRGFPGRAQLPGGQPIAQPVLPAAPAGTFSNAQSIPQPANNVNGNPANVTPTASQIPVTNSVPVDSLPTPSTTPASSGIVDTPNPADPNIVNPIQANAAAAGAAASGASANNPATAITPPVGTTTTPPAGSTPATPSTPQQIFEQLQKMRQQNAQPGTATTPQ